MRTGLSATDLLNRSITVYEFADAQLRTGQELLLRDRSSGGTWSVQFR